MSEYVGRLAPSPTGLLHVGHARTFRVAFERARTAGGRLWLRDDDLDGQRSRQEFAAAMREDLRWLGITWDSEARQSERLGLYRQAMQRLMQIGAVYPCSCSRRDLRLMLAAPHEQAEDEAVYRGRCRETRLGEAPLIGVNYRFRVTDHDRVLFVDELAGEQAFVSGCGPDADFGDFLVWRRDGLPSYQLACVVDDEAMGVTEVVRGRDLLKSTARQMLLQRTLGFRTPRYAHTDLLRDSAGVRLAKRHDALSLRALRESGATPQQLLSGFLKR